MRTLSLVAIAAALAIPSIAHAQDDRAIGTVGTTVGGAAVGAVVGGPVGAVVGAGVGAIVGSSLPPEPSVTYDRPVVVGEELPNTVTLYPVPRYTEYDYAVVNHRRVIVDRGTHRVVRVID